MYANKYKWEHGFVNKSELWAPRIIVSFLYNIYLQTVMEVHAIETKYILLISIGVMTCQVVHIIFSRVSFYYWPYWPSCLLVPQVICILLIVKSREIG